MNAENLNQLSRSKLYEEAKKLDIDGRSSMTKDQLVDAVASAANGATEATTRFDEFERVADQRATGQPVFLPRHLSGDDRHLHVRRTLREDHRNRITDGSDDARKKFDELADSLFSFFRGTALLFYRDMAGEDGDMPTVLALGDVHPENFGVMPNADNVPMFGVNDFDEAYYAPFTWDLKRGATGFWIAAKEEGDLNKKKRRRVVEQFVKGYLRAMRGFADERNELEQQVRYDNAPKMIAKLIKRARRQRKEWLAENYHEEFGRGFRDDDELIPVSSRIDEFQELVDRWVAENDIAVPKRAGAMKVKDVAVRRGQGTASLGLSRFYVLIEGERADATDDIIIEFKQARRSALAGLVPPTGLGDTELADRIAHAQGVQLVRADVFYGSVEFEGASFMSRERAPYRDDIDLDDLSFKQWRRYAAICGRALAQAHALSDDVGEVEGQIEPKILAAVEPQALFVNDMVRFAEATARRLKSDHKTFKADHRLEAFGTVDVHFD